MHAGPVRQSRDYRIDMLRGLSILSVLLLHFNIAYRLVKSPLGWLLPGPYLVNLVWSGNYGVTVFFVISGYLITSTSLRRFGSLGGVSAKTFYAFRFARIFPCLILVLVIITALAFAGIPIFRGSETVSIWLSDLSILTFWHNVLMAKFGYFNYCLNVLWSLSVEEVFYLTFPLLCLLLRRSRWIVPIWIAAIVAGPIYRSYHSRNEIEFLYGYLACFDAIAMGCCTAVLVRSARVRRLNNLVRNIVQLVALAFMLWIFLRAGIDSVPVWGTSLMAIGAAVFLFAEGASRYEDNSERATRFVDKLPGLIAWFGRHSYELYLFHIVLLAGLQAVLPRARMSPAARPLWLLIFLAVSALVAWAIARFYSEPLNDGLRARLVKRPLA
jgi:peptidoglycan/LPS O-acetylase OafA/YrhL